jgi:hypothetical protein
VAVLNVAQAGTFVIENTSVPPRGLEAVGVNEYALPVSTLVGGVPLIVGGAVAPDTVIVKGASEADADPSDTEIVMFEFVPTFD